MTVYFDNAATTKPCPEAVEAVMTAMTEEYGNPSSGYSLGRRAAAKLREARESVAAALGAAPDEVFFTSGGTEGDNWAIRGAARLRRHKCKHLITSAAEHDAVRHTIQALEADGWEATYLAPDKSGRISASQVADAVRDDTALVSIMLVNNETGVVNPISEIAGAVKNINPRTIIHTDAVQAFLNVPFTPKKLGVDLLTVSSHKIHGPKGAGALYVRRGLRLPPLLTGGGQEGGSRPGTEAMPAILGFAAAAKVGKEHFAENAQKIRALREYLIGKLRSSFPEIVLIGDGGASHILSISLSGYKSEVLMNYLDAAGICVSKSSACRKGARSHVLESMSLPSEIIDGAVRIGLSRYNTAEEADYFAATLSEAAGRLRRAK